LQNWVHGFGLGKPDGAAGDVSLLGGKGANMRELSGRGLPVPPGFTIGTDACRAFLGTSKMPDGLKDGIMQALKALEAQTRRAFGSAGRPLLVSVRAGRGCLCRA
jgi:pyruvate, orthophosphate dikinase